MKYNLMGLSMVALVSGFLVHISSPVPAVNQNNTIEVTEEEEDFAANVEVLISYRDNTCTLTNSAYFDEVINIEYPDKTDKISGRWNPNTMMIQLMQPGGLDLATVAHEVSHAVDTIMIQHPGIDEHYEAYLQGTLTACVWYVLQHDISMAGKPDFGFAN